MTKFTVEGNPNYAASIVALSEIVALDGCDNVQGARMFGYQAIVGKDANVGDVVVVFGAETRLSHEYVSANNLYRDATLNADSTKTGYIEKNRRVRSMKFRGHRSDALVMPLSSLVPFGYTTGDALAAEFDTVNGVMVCEKYEVPAKGTSGPQASPRVWSRVDAAFLPEHVDTSNYFRKRDDIGPDEFITVTQKLHGTSIRIGNTIVRRKLSWFERLLGRFGVPVATTSYDLVYGSRRVIKDANNPDQNHFYDYDLWTTHGSKYAASIPENVIVYGELIGWASESTPIQAHYTYQVPRGDAELWVYRVAVVSSSGELFDLSWPGVQEFCRYHNLNCVRQVWSGFHRDFVAEDFIDRDLGLVPLDDDSPCDEGVVVRVEGVTPTVYKAKSPRFLAHETKMLDLGDGGLE